MAKLGRPPRCYTITITKLGDAGFEQTIPCFGAREVGEYLGLRELVVTQMLSVLGGEFSRKREDESGAVIVEHVKRVD